MCAFFTKSPRKEILIKNYTHKGQGRKRGRGGRGRRGNY
jgi:hypothetical protein